MLCDRQPAGAAAPLVIGRHSHPRATPEIPETMPVPATGIDYLALIDAARDNEIARTVNYAALIHTHGEHGEHGEHESTARKATGTRPDAEDHSEASALEEGKVGA